MMEDINPLYSGNLVTPLLGQSLASPTSPASGYDAMSRVNGVPSAISVTIPTLKVSYADPEHPVRPPSFVKSSDPFVLDPDPFGKKTVEWGRSHGLSMTDEDVPGLVVLGRPMSRDHLMESDAGRRLLELTAKNKKGVKRGFLDALTDVSWSDLPFFSLFATVGGSISDAVTVSDTMKKLQNGENVTDDELIKTRLFMAEQEYRENGSWGAMVGDIVRAAPGFMTEFLMSGTVFSAIRTGLAKAAGKTSVHLALTRAEKKLAGEATEMAAKTLLEANKTAGAVSDFASLAAKENKDSVINQVTDKLVKFMTNKETAANPLLTGAEDTIIRDIAKKRAIYEFDRMMLRNSSDKMIVRGLNKFSQWAGRHVSSGILDFGSWGTEEATILTSSFTKARSALADAVGVMFVEAPIRGSLLMAPNAYIMKPLLESAFTEDGRTVSSSQLELQYSALLKGDRDLMASAESFAHGMNWLEYVSENAGRGFGSLARGVGLWLDESGLRKAVRGIVRPAAESAAGAGSNVASEGFSIGGVLRRMWKDSIGSRADVVARTLDDKVTVVGGALRSAGVAVDDAAVRKAIQTGTISGVLPSGAESVVGNDIASFAEKAVRKYYDDKGKAHLLRYIFADFMTRHNIGPESMLNLYNKMGYDGILGEMMEERYSDVAKGMFGWYDSSNRDIASRLAEAAKGLWPGFSQLTAEAVGFAVPTVTRMGAARVIAKIGGEGKFAKLRDKLETFGDINKAPLTWSGRLMDYFEVSRASSEEHNRSVADAEKELEAAQESGDQERIDEATSRLEFVTRTRDRYAETNKRWLEGYAKSKKISVDSVEEWARENADELVAIEPLSRSEAETEGVGYVMRPVKDSDITAKAMQSHDNLVDFTPELMRMLYESDAPLEGESPSGLRWVASKLVGIAGSIITGDYSLAFRDPASWISRDMGFGKDFVRSLKSKYLQKRNEIEAKLRDEMITGAIEQRMHDLAMYGSVPRDYVRGTTFSLPEKYIDDVTQNAIASEARRMMTSYLASQGVRSFSRTQAKDQATVLRARRLGYDIVNMESRTFAKSSPVVTETVPEETETFNTETIGSGDNTYRIPGAVPVIQSRSSEFNDILSAHYKSRGYVRKSETVYSGGTLHQHTIYYKPDDGTGKPVTTINGKNYVEVGVSEDPAVQYMNDPEFAETVNSYLISKGYTIDENGNVSRVLRPESTRTTGGIDNSSMITFDEFFDKEKDEIYGLTNEISKATLDIIANRTSMSLDSCNRLMPVVTLPEGSDLERVAIYDAAMRMAGMASAITTAQLRKDRTLEDTVRESEITSVSAPVVEAICDQAAMPDGTYDPSKVRRDLLESVAYSLGLRFDGTSKSLAERDRKIVELCALTMQVNSGKGRYSYFRIDSDPRSSEPSESSKGPKDRISDPFVIVRAERTPDGTLVIKKEFVQGAGEETITASSEKEMLNKLREKSFNASIAPATVRWTQARVLTTDDPVVALRTTGALREYVNRTVANGVGQDDPMAYVHPMFRLDESGNYVFTEAEAETKLAEELALASNYDGKNLIRLPGDGASAAQIAAATKAAREAWEHVYGKNGYMTVADSMLSSRNVDIDGVLGTVSGFSSRTPRYSMSLNTFFSKSADIIVPVDFNSTVDLKDSLLNARMLQAYALHPREIGNTFRKDIEGFLQELDKLVLVKIREATKSGKTRLAESLVEFRKSVTSPVVRVKDVDGKKVRRIGVRITPQSFATLATTLCMFRDKRMTSDGFGQVPWVMAITSIADDARNLSSYIGFETAVDVVLGGTGFLRDLAAGEEGVADSTGISGLMRVFHNDPAAVSKYSADYGFGGMSYTEFLDACDAKLKNIADRPVPKAVSKELRGKASSVRSHSDRSGLVRDLAKETGLSGNDLRDFIMSAIRLAHAVSPATADKEDTLAAVREAEKLAGKARASGEKLADAYARLEKESSEKKTLEARLSKALADLAESRARVNSLRAKKEQAAAANMDTSELQKQLADAEARAAMDAGNAGSLTSSVNEAKSRVNSLRDMINSASDGEVIDSVEDDTSDEGEEDASIPRGTPVVRNAVNASEADDLPDLWSMYSGDGINGTALVELTDNELSVGTVLSADDAKKAASVVVRRILSSGGTVTYRDFHDGVVSLFRTLPSSDVRFLMEQFDALSTMVRNGSTTWRDVASSLTMRSITDDKDEAGGTDTSSEDQRIERDAVSELTGDDMKSFLSLARYVSPATGANLQAFVDSIRNFARRELFLSTNEDDRMVYNLLNPMAMVEYGGRELVNDCERDAVYAMTMNRLVSDEKTLSRTIDRVGSKSPATAFLLSYVTAMVPGDRDRFMHLIANSSSCDAYSRKMESKGGKRKFRMTPANAESKRVSQAAVAGSLSTFIGMTGEDVLRIADQLEQRFLPDDRGAIHGFSAIPDKLDPLGYVKIVENSVNIIADELAKYLGAGSPICDALRSEGLLKFIRRAVTAENKVKNSKKQKKTYTGLVRAVARSMSVQDIYDASTNEKRPGIAFVSDIVGALRVLGTASGVITPEDAEVAAIAAFTAGDARQDSMTMGPRSSRVTNPLCTFFGLYASSQPSTIMRADRDVGRSMRDSSVAITSRGVVPVIARWMNSDKDTGFSAYAKKYFRPEIDAWLSSPEAKALIDARVSSSPSGGETDRGSLETEARSYAEKVFIRRCRQNMEWPDGTRILAKNITTTSYANELVAACTQMFVDNEDTQKYLVPMYSGDHNSAVMVQVPRRVLSEDISSAHRAAVAGYKEYAGKPDDHTINGLTRKEYQNRANNETLPELYRRAAMEICDAVGLDMLGKDAKRSAVSSMEQAGTSMRGAEMRDGKLVFGEHRLHIMFNYQSRKNARMAKSSSQGNEDLKGMTMTVGYGAERQRAMAKLQGTNTLKLHLISATGRDLSFIKSLSSAPAEGSGTFYEKDCKSVIQKFLSDSLGGSKIDSASLTDFDSYKVGPANAARLTVNGKPIIEFIVDELGKKYNLEDGGHLPADLDFEKEFAGYTISESDRSDGVKPPEKISDVLKGLKISEITGLRGTTISVSYVDNDMMAYSVANVSHTSEETTGRTPRNYMTDATTEAMALLRANPSMANRAAVSRVLDLISDWGLAATAVYGRGETISSLIKTSSGLRALLDAGESPDGIAMKEELFRTAWAKMRENLNIPMDGVDSPLIATGAGVSLLKDADGNVLYDDRGRPMITCLSESDMLRDINYGSVVFTEEESKFYRSPRRIGLSQVNVRERSFRYGWWLDEAKFDEMFMGGAVSSDKDRLLKLESLFVGLRASEAAVGEDGKPFTDVVTRMKIAECFIDHHGTRISDYGEDMLSCTVFEDLFRMTGDGNERFFDRSAVQIDGDRVANDATGRTHVFLGGTLFGIPRTPSYRPKWTQMARASIPVDEDVVEVTGKDGKKVNITVAGPNAAVAPDPLSNEILGCDNDGDKSKIFFLHGVRGHVDETEFPRFDENGQVSDADLERFGDDPDARKEYYDRLVDSGFVSEKYNADGSVVRKISDKARHAVSNRFVRAVLDMGYMLPCPGDGSRRVSFLGGDASNPTRQFPGSQACKKKLLDKKYPRNGSGPTIGVGHGLHEVDLACDITTKAKDVSRGRARAVSLAKALHHMWQSGYFNKGSRNLFRGMSAESWFRFSDIYDGLPNSTFDDMKEQKCSRFGFTEGMMAIITCDMFLNHDEEKFVFGKIPTTEAEFDEVITRYVDSVNTFGSRYYMMMASSEAYGDGIRRAIKKWVTSTSTGVNSWASFFGVEHVTFANGKSAWKVTNKSQHSESSLTVGRYISRLVSDIASSEDSDIKAAISESGLTESGMLRLLAYSGRATDATTGHLFWLAKELAGVEGTDDFTAIAKSIKDTRIDYTSVPSATKLAHMKKIVSFMRLTHCNEILEEGREFGNSYNYTSADPGADWAASSSSQVDSAYARVVNDYGVKDKDPGGVVFYDYYRKMHAATKAVYGIGYGLETVATRSAESVEDHRDDSGNAHDDTVLRLHGVAKDHPGLHHLERCLVGLTSLQRIDPSRIRELKASVQMTPYFIAALQTAGNGSPIDNLETLRKISAAVSRADGYQGDSVQTEDRSGVFRVIRGITAAFDLMYRLVTTSTEHFSLEGGNSAFSYFSEQADSSFSAYDGGSKSIYRIVPQFGGSTDVLANHARDLVRRVMDGKSFTGERRRSGSLHVNSSGRVVDNPTAKATVAKSFTLSVDNLTAMAEEILSGTAKKREEDRVELPPDLAEQIELVKSVVREIGDITPQRMFNELLPLYTAFTTRTTGAPQAGSGSLLSLLPGVYEKWSERVVKNDVVSIDLVNAIIGANTSPVSNKEVHGVAFDVPNSQLRRKNLRPGETPSAAYRRMFRENTPTEPDKGADNGPVKLKTDEIADWSVKVLGLGSRYSVDAWNELQKTSGARIAAIRDRLSSAGLPASEADDPRRIMFELALERNLMRTDKSDRPPCAPPRQQTEDGKHKYWYSGKYSATSGRRLVDPSQVSGGDMNAPLAKLIAKHGSIIVFDTETTGLDSENGQLIQISAAKYVADPATGGITRLPVDTYTSLVRTADGSSVPEESSRVHHITDDDLAKDGVPELKEAMARFMGMLEPVDGKRPLLVAHNVKFDAAILSMSLSRLTGDSSALDGVDFLDTLTVFRDRASVTTDRVGQDGKNEWVGSRLGVAVTHYGLDSEFANDHTADGDMNALTAVLMKMFEERDDLHEYVNKFGVVPKYGEPVARIPGVVFVEQPGNAKDVPITEKAIVDPSECAYAKPPSGMYYLAKSEDTRALTSRSSSEDSDDVETNQSPAVPVTQRESPENRPTIDPFVGDGLFAHAAQYLLNPAPAPKVVKNSFGAQVAKDLRDGLMSRGRSLPESEVDPQTVRAANTMRALLPWARVEYTGKSTFVIRGRLRSGFSSASGTVANSVITVTVGDNETCATEGHVLGLAYSPAYASSFVAAKGREFGLETAEDFFRLPLDVRMNLVKRYSVGAAALNRPLWTVDAHGMATLVGAIQIGKSKTGTNLYHEYFHSMIGMFRQLGVFGEEDIVALQNAFGRPPAGTDMLFDEEIAAERFRKFVKSNTESDRKVRGIFQRIFDFIKSLLLEMSRGFRYSTSDAGDAERKLFSLVISGIAAKSDSTLMEADATRIADRAQTASDIAARLADDAATSGYPLVVPLKGKRTVRILADGDVIGKNVKYASEKAVREVSERLLRTGVMTPGMMTAEDSPEELVVDAESSPEDVQASGEISSEVNGMLTDPSCGEDRIAEAMSRLAAVRGGMAVNQAREDELSPYFGMSESYENMRFAVELGTAPLASFSNPFRHTGRVLAEAIRTGLENDGSWAMGNLEKLQRRYTGGSTMAARKADTLDKAVIRRAIADLNATLTGSDKIPADIEDNLVFETMLAMRNEVSSFAADGKDAPGAEAYVRATGSASSLTALKAHASVHDISAWVLSSSGVSIADVVSDTISRMNDYASRCGPAGKRVIEYYIGLLDEVLDTVGDPKSLASYIERNFDEDRFDSIIPRAVVGLQYPGLDPSGNIGDYALTEEAASSEPSGKRTLSADTDLMKGVVDDPTVADYAPVQSAMKEAIGTIFRAKAMCKFCAETDLVPASPEDVAYAHQASGMAVSGQSAEQWCADQAIGNSNFLDNEGLVDYYDQSYFIANNMEQWLASQVRPVFGGVDIGEALRRDEHEYLGIMSEITNAENLDAFLFGDSEVPGQNLLAIDMSDDRFSIKAGEIRHGESSGKVLGFDNYNKKRCSVSFTVDEHRLVDWFKKSVTAYVRGQKNVVTGVNRISFTERDLFHMDYDPKSIENMIATRSSSVKITQFQWSLYRLLKQVPPAVAQDGKDADGNTVKGLYSRFVDAARSALDKASATLNSLRNNVLAGKATADDKAELEQFDFNHEVLSSLEAAGLVICRRSGSKCTEAVLVQSVDDIDRRFRESTAYQKLVSDARWAGADGLVGDDHLEERKRYLSRDTMAARYRALYEKLARFVKEHPWMTGGDVKYMTSFGTRFPFFRGSGLFMANAIRTDRDGRPSVAEKMSGYEKTFLWLCTTKNTQYRMSEVPLGEEPNVDEALGVMKAMLGLRTMSIRDVRKALVEGQFSAGGSHVGTLEAYGTEISADPTLSEVRDVLYRLCLAKTWNEANGRATDMSMDAAEYVRVYEQSTGASGSAIGGLGMTDEMMYRLHGVLPANYQIGKMVSKAAEQITNVMMHRNTFMSMMLAPSSDGAPVYYMKPSETAAETSGIPDVCWSVVARWWASFHGIPYDEASTGVENASRIYDLLRERGMTDPKHHTKTWRLRAGESDHRYVLIDDKDVGLPSVSGILCMEDEDRGEGDSAINALVGGEAAGYMKQFAWSGRNLGFAGVRAGLHRVMSWSKSLSVSFSFFFPLATRFESPIGAVGAIPTMVGNSSFASGMMRSNPELFNRMQKLFGGSGWITKDFFGTADALSLMDTDSPFLAELKSYAHALGITMYDTKFNPMEPTKSIIEADVRKFKLVIARSGVGAEMSARIGEFLDMLVTRSGERAFTYALNAVKLATIAQLVSKLRHEARLRKKAFDPIRDLRRYSRYLNAEIGGIDERSYAWAHPMFRSMMNVLLFSWPWTRGAWEAGGGTVIEDFAFGGHSLTREERKYLLGRWARMYGEVMIGVPAMVQMIIKAAAVAAGRDDPDDKWFTWQNEDKSKWTAYNITPLMRVLHDSEDVAGLMGRAIGAVAGWSKLGVPGAIAGAMIGDRLVPNYRGSDQGNAKTRSRKYYQHFGKQGWEFFRWFDEPGKQVAGKLSMPVQRILEGLLGRNLGYLDHELPWNDMGAAERWLSLTADSALVNFAKAFVPFTVTGMTTFGDAGALPMFGPVQMGASQTAVQDRLRAEIEKWAANDRSGYRWGARTVRKGPVGLYSMFGAKVADILQDAKVNGLDPAQQLATAVGQVMTKYYSRLFRVLPENASDDYDTKELSKVCRSLHRLGSSKRRIMQSVKKRYDATSGKWNGLSVQHRGLINNVIGQSWANPFSSVEVPGLGEYAEAADAKGGKSGYMHY